MFVYAVTYIQLYQGACVQIGQTRYNLGHIIDEKVVEQSMIRWLLGAGVVLLLLFGLLFGSSKGVVSDIENMFSSWFDNVASVPELAQLHRLREGFLHNNLSLKVHQTDYVYEITSSKDALAKFHLLYCVKQDKNPFLYGANLAKMCAHIQKTDLI